MYRIWIGLEIQGEFRRYPSLADVLPADYGFDQVLISWLLVLSVFVSCFFTTFLFISQCDLLFSRAVRRARHVEIRLDFLLFISPPSSMISIAVVMSLLIVVRLSRRFFLRLRRRGGPKAVNAFGEAQLKFSPSSVMMRSHRRNITRFRSYHIPISHESSTEISCYKFAIEINDKSLGKDNIIKD